MRFVVMQQEQCTQSGRQLRGSPTCSTVPVATRGVIAVLLLCWAWGTLPVAAADNAAGPVLDFKQDVEPLFDQYCFGCHGYGGDEGGLQLDELADGGDRKAAHQKWLAVWNNLRAQTMPPSGEEQPSGEERGRLVGWIEREVFRLDSANPDPGRVTIRRLNRQEYENTIHDLLGVEFDAVAVFPPDDTGYGFDTIGDVLSISPLQMEKYLEAARSIAAQAVRRVGDAKPAAGRRLFEGPVPPDRQDRREYLARNLRRLADRAFRRPVDEPTLAQFVELADEASGRHGLSFEEAAAHALTAILASPRFLFRAEVQPQPNDPARIVPLDEFALASRLSYFLWSTMPDDELFRLAREGQLRANLRGQVDRMLDDPRSARLVENFVGQWLQTRDVETINIDARRVLGLGSQQEARRKFDGRLRRAMRQETELLFAHLLKENASLLDMLTADYTFANEPLARWYGIEGVRGDKMQQVALPADSRRGGILTQASFLIVTSNPTRTSPVKRGLFILENLLGTPPPPAPPDVPELEAAQRGKDRDLTMRQLMEVHREKPLCASCHARMDPLGLALEEYNALGVWRESERGQTIETAGRLITGEEFDDTRELAQVLATDRRHDFYRCVSEKLWTYAIGRGVEYYDAPTIDHIVRQLEREGGQARTLIYGIVESAPFQRRRGDGS